MRRSEILARGALGLLLVGFLLASQQLFSNRHWQGDVYPELSSFSSRPDGTRALYEALAALPGLEVERNQRPLGRLADEPSLASSTVIAAGWPAWQLDGGDFVPEGLDRLALAGARVIVAAVDLDAPWSGLGEEEEDERAEEERDPAEPRELREAEERARRWAFELHRGEQEAPVARYVGDPGQALPDEIHWRSPLHLAGREGELSQPWRVLYSVDGLPVLAERPFGDNGGWVVLAASSFFLSNEAQSEDRQPELLAYLLGPSTRIVFDEAHLGLATSPGVVALARRYRLHGVGVAIVAVFGLAVWRGSARLLPSRPSSEPRTTSARSSREGLVALLRRGIPRSRLLTVCLEQWTAAAAGERPSERAVSISRGADPVRGYRLLAKELEPPRGVDR